MFYMESFWKLQNKYDTFYDLAVFYNDITNIKICSSLFDYIWLS